MEQLHAVVHGLVQGVYYRATLKRSADSLGICGWIRNLPDGNVETLAQGSRAALESYVQALYRGSTSSRVTRVEVTWQVADEAFDGFWVR